MNKIVLQLIIVVQINIFTTFDNILCVYSTPGQKFCWSHDTMIKSKTTMLRLKIQQL